MATMARDGEDEGDERDLINAEFESMVADLNLDQSSPRTYLDDLAEIEKEEQREHAALYQIQSPSQGIRESIAGAIAAMKSWWQRKNRNDGDGYDDGAVL